MKFEYKFITNVFIQLVNYYRYLFVNTFIWYSSLFNFHWNKLNSMFKSGWDLSEYKMNLVTQHWEFVEGYVVMMLGHVGDVASAFAETPMASLCCS